MAGLLPGEPLDLTRLEIFKKRLGGTGVFNMSQDQGKPIDIKMTNRRPHDKPYGDVPMGDLDGVDPDPDAEPRGRPRAAVGRPAGVSQAPSARARRHRPAATAAPGVEPAPGGLSTFGGGH